MRCIGLAAICLAAAVPVTAQNLLVNPSFDGALSGWTTPNTTWVANDGNPSGSGPGCAEVAIAMFNGGLYAMSQSVPVTGGADYVVSGWALVPSAADNSAVGAEAAVLWQTDTSDLNTSWLPQITDRGAWTLARFQRTAPANATRAVVMFGVRVPNAGSGVPRARWDDVKFEKAGGQAEYFVPVVSHVQGLNGTFWTTELTVHNPLATMITAGAAFLKGDGDNSTATYYMLDNIAPGATKTFPDVVGSMGGSGTGALRVRCTSGSTATSAVVTARTTTPAGDRPGSYGQGTIARGPAAASHTGVPGVVQTSAMRSNVGAVNTTSNTVQVRVRVLDAQGATIVDQTWSVGPYGHRQSTLPSLGVTSLNEGTVVFDGPGVIGYVTPVDNSTGDAIYLEAQPLP